MDIIKKLTKTVKNAKHATKGAASKATTPIFSLFMQQDYSEVLKQELPDHYYLAFLIGVESGNRIDDILDTRISEIEFFETHCEIERTVSKQSAMVKTAKLKSYLLDKLSNVGVDTTGLTTKAEIYPLAQEYGLIDEDEISELLKDDRIKVKSDYCEHSPEVMQLIKKLIDDPRREEGDDYLFSRCLTSSKKRYKADDEPENFRITRQSAWYALNKINDKLKDMFTHYGLKIALHTWRKTYAFNVYRGAGNDLEASKEALHHASEETTKRYIMSECKAAKRASSKYRDSYRAGEIWDWLNAA